MDRPLQDISVQKAENKYHATSGIRAHDFSVRAAKTRDQCDTPSIRHCTNKLQETFKHHINIVSMRNVESFYFLSLFLDLFLLGGGGSDLFSLSPPAGFILVGRRGCRKSKRTQRGRVEGQGVSRASLQLFLKFFLFYYCCYFT